MAEAEIVEFDPNHNYDEEIASMQREIEKEVCQASSLIGPLESLVDLVDDYTHEDAVYQKKIQELCSRYSHVRKVRRDGNCFFRSFGFAFLESLLRSHVDYVNLKSIAHESKEDLLRLNFPKFTIEDFYENFIDAVELVEGKCSTDDLLATFNNQGKSDYFVVYLRLIVSGHLQKEADFYSSFIEGGRTAREFCSQEVEPMGRESDHIHIIALSSALKTGVLVEYMDRAGDACNQLVFPDGSQPSIHLLYRPGHYDILYSRQPC